MTRFVPALVLCGALACAACEGEPPPPLDTKDARADGLRGDVDEDERDDTPDAVDAVDEGEVDTRDDGDGELEVDTRDAEDADGDGASDAREIEDGTDTRDVGDTADTRDDTAEPPDTDDTREPDTTTVDTTPETITPNDSDDVFGVSVPRATSWWVGDGRIHRGAPIVRLRGVNWFGLETPDRALHGTWFGRTVEDFLAELRGLGFDSLRVPLSPESINPGFASASWASEAYESGPATTGREHLERLIAAAEAADFTLLLDFHTCNPNRIGAQLPGRPDGCDGYDVTRWLADLGTLATLAIGHEHVVGVDLTNEPHALTWPQWKALAERGGEAVLRANPRLLVFVEGVAGLSEAGGYYPFWGENLTAAGVDPPAIHAARLVFSPHTYGPGIAAQTYFDAAGFPANMPTVWRTHFGYLSPRWVVAVGEFGGHYDDAEAQGEVAWNEAFVAYLATLDRGGPASFYYWAVNPNSGDTGGLYEDDWVTLVDRRLRLLAPLLGP